MTKQEFLDAMYEESSDWTDGSYVACGKILHWLIKTIDLDQIAGWED
jgi:hypothetical protein